MSLVATPILQSPFNRTCSRKAKTMTTPSTSSRSQLLLSTPSPLSHPVPPTPSPLSQPLPPTPSPLSQPIPPIPGVWFLDSPLVSEDTFAAEINANRGKRSSRRLTQAGPRLLFSFKEKNLLEQKSPLPHRNKSPPLPDPVTDHTVENVPKGVLKPLQIEPLQINSKEDSGEKKEDSKANGVVKSLSVVSEVAVEATEIKENVDVTKEEAAQKAPDPSVLKRLLEGVVAHVDVKTEDHNKSGAIEKLMRGLGAQVKKRITCTVTHVVFKDGRKATYDKAKRLNLHLVAVRWIDACKKNGARVPESLFPPVCAQEYDSPFFPDKPKRIKYLTPRGYEEQMERIDRMLAMRKKRLQKKRERENKLKAIANGMIPQCSSVVPERLPTIAEGLLNISPRSPDDYLRLLPNWKPYDPFESPFAKEIWAKMQLTPQVQSEMENNDSDVEIIEDIPRPVVNNSPTKESPREIKNVRKIPFDSLDETIEAVVEGEGEICTPAIIEKTSGKRKREERKEVVKKNGRRKLMPLFQAKLLEVDPQETVKNDMGSQVPKKKPVQNEPMKKENTRENSTQTCEVLKWNRRSLDDFQTQKKTKRRREAKRNATDGQLSLPKSVSDHRAKPSIVCTSMKPEDFELIRDVVKKLGGFVLRASFDLQTTHVLTGAGNRRTLNMLRGLAKGCWILHKEWVLKSMEADKWLPEASFEVIEFSPAVKQCRLQRESEGKAFQSTLFSSVGPIYVSQGSSPPREDLEQLVKWCGGTVAKVGRAAEVVVGRAVDKEGSGVRRSWSEATVVSEKWVLDSVHQYQLQPTNQYSAGEGQEQN